jgi:hypothetical protein
VSTDKPGYTTSKLDGASYCTSNGHFARHLRANNITQRDYHETYITGVTPLCDICWTRPLSIGNSKSAIVYRNTCGSRACAGAKISAARQSFTDEDWEAQTARYRATMSAKSVEEIAEYREKISVALTTENADGVRPIDVTAEKRKQAKLAKYGDAYWSNSAKASETRFGFDESRKNDINQKRSNTLMERYGVEHLSHSVEFLEKAWTTAHRLKEYVMPSGAVVRIQGYEPTALNILLNEQGYSEDQLVTGSHSVPTIPYELAGRRRRHFPDIYIPAENRLIEVKSSRTFGVQKSKNLEKKIAAEALGYAYEIWVCSNKELLEIIK